MSKHNDRESYIKYCLTLGDDTLRKALQDICKKAGIADCTVFLSAGGFSYTIRYLTSQIYLTNIPINALVRTKINILNIIHETDIEDLKGYNYLSVKKLYKQADESYYKNKYGMLLKKLELKIPEKIKSFLGDEIKCRKCGSLLGPLWHGWELCDKCGYRYNVIDKKKPR